MRAWDGQKWTPARSWNGVWWNNLARDKAHFLTYGNGSSAQINVGVPGNSWTMLVRTTTTTGTWGRFGGNTVGTSRFRFFGTSSVVQLQAILGLSGSDGQTVTQDWARTSEAWAWVTYDGHKLTSSYAGDVRVDSLSLTGFSDLPTTSGLVPLRVETPSAGAILIQQHLTPAECESVLVELKTAETTHAIPALLAPMAPVADLTAGQSVTLALPETSPRTLFQVATTNVAGVTIRNANGTIMDNRLGSVCYDSYVRTVYIRPDGVQVYLDTAGTNQFCVASWWDGTTAGHQPRIGSVKTAPASITPMPWTVLAGTVSERMLVWDAVLPEWQRGAILNWLYFAGLTGGGGS